MKLYIDNHTVEPRPDQSLFDIVKELGLIQGKLSSDPMVAKIAGRVFTLNYVPLRSKDINPDRESERFSAFLIAIFLGTNSPRTMLKNERMIVISTTNTDSGITIPLPATKPSLLNQFVRGSAKVSAANADPKNPARVIATWMVERNLEESFVSF